MPPKSHKPALREQIEIKFEHHKKADETARQSQYEYQIRDLRSHIELWIIQLLVLFMNYLIFIINIIT